MPRGQSGTGACVCPAAGSAEITEHAEQPGPHCHMKAQNCRMYIVHPAVRL